MRERTLSGLWGFVKLTEGCVCLPLRAYQLKKI